MRIRVRKYIDISKRIMVCLLIFILLYELTWFRDTIANIIILAENSNITFGLSINDFLDFYNKLRIYSIVCLVLMIFVFLLFRIVLIIKKYSKVDETKLSVFEKSLYHYLEKECGKKGYLISGEWGSGKTYSVFNFFEKLYKFSDRPIYNVSCFGLDSRELVLKEIKNQIELNDNSLFNWLKYIPIIGQPIFGIFKGTYGLQSISKKAIFIFDDFERITPLGVSNINQRLYSTRIRQNRGTEFNDFYKEFKNIEEAFTKISQKKENEFLVSNLQKYNVVTGLINELIENYDLKVIIVCNADILGYDYVDKIFRGKLDCITYNKFADDSGLENIFKEALENQIFRNEDFKDRISDITMSIFPKFKCIFLANENRDLRRVKTLIQAYLETLSIVENSNELTENYISSLFYSIYVVLELRNKGNLEKLELFPIGSNLLFCLDLFSKNRYIDKKIFHEYISDIRWVGASVAGFWILNMKTPEDIEGSVKSFEFYQYFKLEKRIVLEKNIDFVFTGLEITLEHVAYIIGSEKIAGDKKINRDFVHSCKEILQRELGDDISIDRTRELFIKLANGISHYTNRKILDILFKTIYDYTKIGNFYESENNVILMQYNSYIENHSLGLECSLEET